MANAGSESKEITIPLAHRQRLFERQSTFGRRIMGVIMVAVATERAAGWELDQPADFESLRRSGRIQWRTAFSLNPLGDMNKAISATVRLTRPRRQ